MIGWTWPQDVFPSATGTESVRFPRPVYPRSMSRPPEEIEERVNHARSQVQKLVGDLQFGIRGLKEIVEDSPQPKESDRGGHIPE